MKKILLFSVLSLTLLAIVNLLAVQYNIAGGAHVVLSMLVVAIAGRMVWYVFHSDSKSIRALHDMRKRRIARKRWERQLFQ